MTFVIYWEKTFYERGFVSYDNPPDKQDEYSPVRLEFATRYAGRKEAEKTMSWYIMRGGFGMFRIFEVKP